VTARATVFIAKTATPTKTPTGASYSGNSNSTSGNQKQIVNNSDKIATDFARIQNVPPTEVKNGQISVLGETEKQFPWTLAAIVGGLLFIFIGVGIYAKNNGQKIKIWMENL
jgi:hypothetical protein